MLKKLKLLKQQQKYLFWNGLSHKAKKFFFLLEIFIPILGSPVKNVRELLFLSMRNVIFNSERNHVVSF